MKIGDKVWFLIEKNAGNKPTAICIENIEVQCAEIINLSIMPGGVVKVSNKLSNSPFWLSPKQFYDSIEELIEHLFSHIHFQVKKEFLKEMQESMLCYPLFRFSEDR